MYTSNSGHGVFSSLPPAKRPRVKVTFKFGVFLLLLNVCILYVAYFVVVLFSIFEAYYTRSLSRVLEIDFS